MSRYTKKGKQKIDVEDMSTKEWARTEGKLITVDAARTAVQSAMEDTAATAGTTEVFTFARLHGKLWSLPLDVKRLDTMKADDERGEVSCTDAVEDVIGQIEKLKDGYGRTYLVQKGLVFTSPGMAAMVVPQGGAT